MSRRSYHTAPAAWRQQQELAAVADAASCIPSPASLPRSMVLHLHAALHAVLGPTCRTSSCPAVTHGSGAGAVPSWRPSWGTDAISGTDMDAFQSLDFELSCSDYPAAALAVSERLRVAAQRMACSRACADACLCTVAFLCTDFVRSEAACNTHTDQRATACLITLPTGLFAWLVHSSGWEQHMLAACSLMPSAEMQMAFLELLLGHCPVLAVACSAALAEGMLATMQASQGQQQQHHHHQHQQGESKTVMVATAGGPAASLAGLDAIPCGLSAHQSWMVSVLVSALPDACTAFISNSSKGPQSDAAKILQQQQQLQSTWLMAHLVHRILQGSTPLPSTISSMRVESAADSALLSCLSALEACLCAWEQHLLLTLQQSSAADAIAANRSSRSNITKGADSLTARSVMASCTIAASSLPYLLKDVSMCLQSLMDMHQGHSAQLKRAVMHARTRLVMFLGSIKAADSMQSASLHPSSASQGGGMRKNGLEWTPEYLPCMVISPAMMDAAAAGSAAAAAAAGGGQLPSLQHLLQVGPWPTAAQAATIPACAHGSAGTQPDTWDPPNMSMSLSSDAWLSMLSRRSSAMPSSQPTPASSIAALGAAGRSNAGTYAAGGAAAGASAAAVLQPQDADAAGSWRRPAAGLHAHSLPPSSLQPGARSSGSLSEHVAAALRRLPFAAEPLATLSTDGLGYGSRLPSSSACGVEHVRQSLRGIIIAFLVPGMPCWWTALAGAAVKAAAGSLTHGSLRVSIALLEIAAHTAAHTAAQSRGGRSAGCKPAGADPMLATAKGKPTAVVMDPASTQEAQAGASCRPAADALLALAPHVLLAAVSELACTVGHINSAAAQAALQQVLCTTPYLHRWLQRVAADPWIQTTASRALLAVSNRMTGTDSTLRTVALSTAQEADVMAAAGRDLLPLVLLAPGPTLTRLITDAVQHPGQLPRLLQLLGSFRPIVCAPLPALARGLEQATDAGYSSDMVCGTGSAGQVQERESEPTALLACLKGVLSSGSQLLRSEPAQRAALALQAGLIRQGLAGPDMLLAHVLLPVLQQPEQVPRTQIRNALLLACQLLGLSAGPGSILASASALGLPHASVLHAIRQVGPLCLLQALAGTHAMLLQEHATEGRLDGQSMDLACMLLEHAVQLMAAAGVAGPTPAVTAPSHSPAKAPAAEAGACIKLMASLPRPVAMAMLPYLERALLPCLELEARADSSSEVLRVLLPPSVWRPRVAAAAAAAGLGRGQGQATGGAVGMGALLDVCSFALSAPQHAHALATALVQESQPEDDDEDKEEEEHASSWGEHGQQAGSSSSDNSGAPLQGHAGHGSTLPATNASADMPQAGRLAQQMCTVMARRLVVLYGRKAATPAAPSVLPSALARLLAPAPCQQGRHLQLAMLPALLQACPGLWPSTAHVVAEPSSSASSNGSSANLHAACGVLCAAICKACEDGQSTQAAVDRLVMHLSQLLQPVLSGPMASSKHVDACVHAFSAVCDAVEAVEAAGLSCQSLQALLLGLLQAVQQLHMSVAASDSSPAAGGMAAAGAALHAMQGTVAGRRAAALQVVAVALSCAVDELQHEEVASVSAGMQGA